MVVLRKMHIDARRFQLQLTISVGDCVTITRCVRSKVYFVMRIASEISNNILFSMYRSEKLINKIDTFVLNNVRHAAIHNIYNPVVISYDYNE